MTDFVNLGPAVEVYKPAGDAESLHVDSGQTITVPGELVEELDDAYLVGTGDDARLWPKVQWELKTAPKSSSKGGSQPAKSDAAPAGQSEGTN